MSVRNFDEFVEWYTKQMSLEDIVLVLYRVMPQLGRDLSQLKRETLRQRLLKVWLAEESRAKTSDALLSVQPEEIKSLGVIAADSLRPMAKKLIEEYGLAPVALSLVVCGDKERISIGFDFINVAEVEDAKAHLNDVSGIKRIKRKSPAVVPDVSVPVRDKKTRRPKPVAAKKHNKSKADIEPISILQMVASCIKEGSGSINIEEFELVLEEVIDAWANYKETADAAERFVQDVVELLSELSPEQRSEIAFVQEIPLEAESYRHIQQKHHQSVKESLQMLRPLAQQALELRSVQASSAAEQKEAWSKTDILWDKIKDYTNIILSCLETDADMSDPEKPLPDLAEDHLLRITPLEEPKEDIPPVDEIGGQDELQSDKSDALPPTGPEVVETIKPDEEITTDPSPSVKKEVSPTVISAKTDPAPPTHVVQMKQAVWKCLGRAQVAEAYWLAREVEDTTAEEDTNPVFPSWLLLASFLSQNATWKSSEEIDLLYNIVSCHPQPCSELLLHLNISSRSLAHYIAITALPAALLAPQTGAHSWLQDAVGHLADPSDRFVQLLNAVIEFAAVGESLDSYHAQISNGALEWGNLATAAAQNAIDWEKEVTGSRPGYTPARKVLGRLGGKDSTIASALEVVKDNKNDEADIVQATLTNWLSSRRAMNKLVEEETRIAYDNRAYVPTIDGKPLEQIIHKLQDLQTIFEDWVAAVNIGNTLEQKGDWRYLTAMKLREQLASYEKFIQEQSSSYTAEPITTEMGSELIESILRQVTRWWLNNFLTGINARIPESEGSANKGDWIRVLRRPLLLLDDPPLDDDGMHNLEQPFQPDEPLWKILPGEYRWEKTCSCHIQNRNFLAADLVLIELTQANSPAVQQISEEKEHRLTEARYLLKERITDTYNRIEQATIDHVLSEADRSFFSGRLLSIEDSSTLKTYKLFDELDQIVQELDELRQERLASLGERIDTLKDDLRVESSDIKNYEAADRYAKLAGQALDSGDLPLADEYLDYAERAVALGIDVGFEGYPATISTVKEFSYVFNNLYNALEDAEKNNPYAVLNLLDRGESAAGLDMRRTTGARRRDIRPAIEAWNNLKRLGRGRKNQQKTLKELTCVLDYVGFRNPEVKLIAQDRNSMHFSATMVAGTLSPLPEFGSDRNNHYDVVLIYSRPSAATIDQTLQQYSVIANCPIVMYLGRITPTQHREWSVYCQSHNLTAMLVDEVLLYYLASQRESRLPAAISCGVAWGYAIPYRSFGIIPREIFKGRQQMVQELADPRGTCIVYGGRQLGKSVLLRMVERDFHRPEQGVYVYYDDIKPLGDPQGFLTPESIWQRLREWLIRQALLPSSTSSDCENLAQSIINTLKSNDKLRIIVLLDEADNFMAADAKVNFQEVQLLKRIMDRTDRRFKVVFCGLHSVQRYCSLANHPFAQLGQPSVVGPLEPRAARDLIQHPMSSLGFVFDKKEHNEAVLKILCYTNYHPALIQLFCQELIMMVRNSQYEPPYEITPQDVEAVYRREDVRHVMRERFEWTVALDARYQAIVYAMIVEQTKERDGYRREFTTTEIHNLVKSWWQEGFGEAPLEQSQSLLEELVDLGVLVKRQGGTYRLRNGNVVRALGSEQEIDRLLVEVVTGPAPMEFDVQHFRSLIDEQRGIRSPFTTKQAGDLMKAGRGIGLIFGSPALGLNHVPRTLKLMFDSGASKNTSILQKMPPQCSSSEQVCNYLRRLAQKKGRERTIVYCHATSLALSSVDLPQVMQDAEIVLNKYCRRNRSVRWLILFDPESTERWVQLPKPKREKAETLADAIFLDLWKEEMVGRFLSDSDLVGSPQVISAVMEATGGWPFLLERFWKLLQHSKQLGDSNPASAALRLKEMLAKDIQETRTKFVDATAIKQIIHGRILFKLVHDLEPVKWNEIPHLIQASGNKSLLQLPIEETISSICALQRLSLLKEGVQGLVANPVLAEAVALD